MYEKETIELYYMIKEEALKNIGDWKASPVENWKTGYFEKNLNEKNLVNFRRTLLSGGTINPPDRPIHAHDYFNNGWLNGIPLNEKLRGILTIIGRLYKLNKLFKLNCYNLSELSDNLIGNPCYYKIGKHSITDFSIRMFYYHEKIRREFACKVLKNIVEVGGGFGGLCLKLIISAHFKQLLKCLLI